MKVAAPERIAVWVFMLSSFRWWHVVPVVCGFTARRSAPRAELRISRQDRSSWRCRSGWLSWSSCFPPFGFGTACRLVIEAARRAPSLSIRSSSGTNYSSIPHSAFSIATSAWPPAARWAPSSAIRGFLSPSLAHPRASMPPIAAAGMPVVSLTLREFSREKRQSARGRLWQSCARTGKTSHEAQSERPSGAPPAPECSGGRRP